MMRALLGSSSEIGTPSSSRRSIQHFGGEEVTPVMLLPQSPNLDAYAERMVQTIRKECLDHFVVFGLKHLDLLMREFIEYYHTERPHQGLDNQPPDPTVDAHTCVRGLPWTSTTEELSCEERLGGLLKCYRWKRAA